MTGNTAAPGMLIDYRDGDTVTAGVVVGEEKGRLLVVSERGREERITASRVALIVGRAGPAGAGRALPTSEAATKAGEHARRAASAASMVELEVLWDLLVDDGEGSSLERLASLALGREDGDACGAVLRALLEDRVRFLRKDDLWFPRSREAVQEMLRQRQREEGRARARERFVRRARSALAGGEGGETGKLASEADNDEETVWRAVEALAVEGPNAPASRGAPELLSQIGVRFLTPEEGAFRVGLALGRFRPDENLFLRRYGLRAEFSEEVREAACRAGARLEAILSEETGIIRRDLREEEAFTVDDEETFELDDALSLRSEPDGCLLAGIHVADPSAFIERGDLVDTEAEARATSHYLPELRIPMIPPELSEQAASLVAGEDRLALSFLVRFSPGGERIGWEVVPSVVRSRRRVAYEEANRLILQSGEPFAALWRIALNLEAERLAAGAVRIVAPEVEARPRPDGTIELLRLDPDRPGRRLVAEMMVLSGRLAADYCISNDIPALYRRQAPPDEPVAPLPAGKYDPVAVRRARRAMRRGEVGTTPGPHAGLGLPAYVQSTSPLRRYQDLVAHRQIAAQLAGRRPPYDVAALQRIAATNEEVERQARLAERGTREYWLLRYLETRAGEVLEGVITETTGRRTDVELSETLMAGSITARPTHSPGQRLRVLVERVVPRAGLLSLREA